jgi:hypothetical protein
MAHSGRDPDLNSLGDARKLIAYSDEVGLGFRAKAAACTD